jgi:type IV fimbrial biogenesis protein FimT
VLKRTAIRAGFTIIEVLLTVAILGVLVMLAAPTFGEWLQSQQLRAAAEASLNGLQVARSEAIRRNLPIMITFNTPQTGWSVTEQPPTSTFIQGRDANEGSPNAQMTPTPGAATTVTFTPLGGVTSNVNGSAILTRLDITNPSGGACQPAGAMRCLRVVISAGGTVRMCDPHPSVVAPDPRACP